MEQNDFDTIKEFKAIYTITLSQGPLLWMIKGEKQIENLLLVAAIVKNNWNWKSVKEEMNRMLLSSVCCPCILTWAGCRVYSCHHETPCSPPPYPGWGPSHQPHEWIDSLLPRSRAVSNIPGPERTHRTKHTPHTTVATARNNRGRREGRQMSARGGKSNRILGTWQLIHSCTLLNTLDVLDISHFLQCLVFIGNSKWKFRVVHQLTPGECQDV